MVQEFAGGACSRSENSRCALTTEKLVWRGTKTFGGPGGAREIVAGGVC